MRVLVLGGNGFIGSHVVDRLIAAGHQVRIFDRSPSPFRSGSSDIDYRCADFGDTSTLAEALEGVDLVYHLISTSVPSTSNLDPLADVQGNLSNTIRLLQLMANQKIPRIIFLSSGGTVYGVPARQPVAETDPLRPICSHGIVKIAIENYLHMFHHLHGLKYIIFRVSNPYGERQGHYGVQGVVGTFIKNIRAGKSIQVWGDGSIVRDFLYIGDLADLCLKAVEQDIAGTFNVGMGKGYSINQVLEIIQSVTKAKIEVEYCEGRNFDVPEIVLDVSRVMRQFGWQPGTDLREGIQVTWDQSAFG